MEDFIRQIEYSISEGRFQDLLINVVNANSNVYILTNMNKTLSDVTGLGSSGIVGIAVGVLFSVLLTTGFIVWLKRKHNAEENNVSILGQSNFPSNHSDIGDERVCSPSSVNPRVASKIKALALVKRGRNDIDQEKEDSNPVSSNSSIVGSSGWSSSFGNSTSGSSDTSDAAQVSKLASKRISAPGGKKEVKGKK
jgi:hypothetical protein